MKIIRLNNLAFLFVLFLSNFVVANLSFATISEDKVIKVSATVQPGTPSITLSWPATAGSGSIRISRKSKGDFFWSDFSLATLSGTATSYVDTNVTVGTAYEYQVFKDVPGDSFPAGKFGYIYAGINVPLVENRGKIILLVDNTHAQALEVKLARLISDLAGDGWTVLRHDISPSDTVPNVKNIILADYNTDPTNVKAVFLFGHIPVPYSGNMAWDAHDNHRGAWPADLYYGELNGVWTDSSVNTSTASRTANRNVPGDGKFDQSSRPTPVELMVGRVDFYDMPAFAKTETQLLEQYLDKDHNFRHAITTVQRRALVEDNLQSLIEGAAQSGWRFSALVGASNVVAGDWSLLLNNDYLLAFGCGGSGYTNVGGVVSTSDYANNSYKVMFQLLFGSYFGDWDNQNNVLRAAIAGPTYGLMSAWGSRPNWHLHHLGLGEPAGIASLVATDTFLYSGGFGRGSLHVGLMGDPSLRLHYFMPPADLNAVTSGNNVNLSWTASSDGNVLGYNVYRGTADSGPFVKLNNTLLAQTSYSDTSPLTAAVYMVRAVKLETSSSGTYYNGSQGIFKIYSSGVTPPSAPVITTNGGNGIGMNFITNNPELVLSGTTSLITSTIIVNGSSNGVSYTPGSASWSYSKILAEGVNLFSVVAVDAAGNISATDSITITLDTVAPPPPSITVQK